MSGGVRAPPNRRRHGPCREPEIYFEDPFQFVFLSNQPLLAAGAAVAAPAAPGIASVAPGAPAAPETAATGATGAGAGAAGPKSFLKYFSCTSRSLAFCQRTEAGLSDIIGPAKLFYNYFTTLARHSECLLRFCWFCCVCRLEFLSSTSPSPVEHSHHLLLALQPRG
jgi:hypothetical protein